MVYLEYETLKAKYRRVQEAYDKDTVQSSPSADMLANYVISEEEKGIDEKLKSLKRLLKERRRLLMAKEEELRMSKNKSDIIYTLKYLDGFGVHKIANTLHYSVSQVYRTLEKIEKRI